MTYSNVCGGRPLNASVTSAQGGHQPSIVLEGHGVGLQGRITGTGPFVLADSNPALTSRATVKPDCRLTIDAINSAPTPAQLKTWSDRKSQLESDLSYYTSVTEAMSKVVELKTAFDLLNRVSQEMSQDISANEAIVSQLIAGSPVRNLLGDLVFSDGIKITDADGAVIHTVSGDDKRSVNALLEATKNLPERKQCDPAVQDCPQLILSQHLTPAEIESIHKMASWVPDIDRVKTSVEQSSQRLVETTSRYVQLCNESKSHIEWPSLPGGCQ